MSRRPLNVGIIGLGARGFWNLGNRILETREQHGLRLRALCDRDPARLQEAREHARAVAPEAPVPELFEDAAPLLALQDLDLVLVTTQSYQHREPAVVAIRQGIRTFCEKPLAHTLEDARAIYDAEQLHANPVMMGFTRRYESTWLKAHELVRNGTIGRVRMLLIRDVIPYSVYFHRWHRRREYSGDALNDKGAHHADVLAWFAGSDPCRVHAFGGVHVYKPDATAPERCLECDRECPYRVRGFSLNEARLPAAADRRESLRQADNVLARPDTCVYAPGADILDHAIVTVEFVNQVRACLFYCIYGYPTDDQETLEVVGDKGKMVITRHTGTIDLFTDYGRTHERIDGRDEHFASGGHFGADERLVAELAAFARGEQPPTVSCRHGLVAATVIDGALRSVDSGQVVPIVLPA